jgi:hypothetical protein
MILTNCAACAAPLPRPAKQCSRCKTLYCGPACQKEHWERGGHDALCKKIKKGGGAEQYHADKKCQEAVAVAVEECAADTKGQTCYICTQALHWKTKEGLVRMCACRGTAGFAHVSCLAEQAKILREDAEYNNLGRKVKEARWRGWHTCGLCEQDYHGVVACALGWACWKAYVDRPETDRARQLAMIVLGNGISEAKLHEDALFVKEAQLSMMRRLGGSENSILIAQSNLANTYQLLKRHEEAMCLRRDVYSGRMKLNGEEHRTTLVDAFNYALSLLKANRFAETKSLMRKTIPVARRVLGENDRLTLKMRQNYARALYKDPAATLDDLREAVTTLAETERTARRLLGGAHPLITWIDADLRNARAALTTRETPSGSA